MNDGIHRAARGADALVPRDPLRLLQVFVPFFVVSLWVLLLYGDFAASMVRVWSGSRTYNHGFLIIPITIYMIWERRRILAAMTAQPSYIGLGICAVAALTLFLADLANVQVVGHFALIAIVVGGIWSIVGTKAIKAIKFPLFFAFLAVPFGESLIPPLMEWTADFAVLALNSSGVPVYREGLYFSLPSGNFEVVAACSGVRYLIVTVVLGIFFAHERYVSWKKQVAFVAAAAAAIIIANGVRAFIVVLVAHLSAMRYGTGADHFVIGWIVFLLVISATFWIGSRWADADAGTKKSARVTERGMRPFAHVSAARYAAWILLTLGVIASGAALAHVQAKNLPESLPTPHLPLAAENWQGPASSSPGYRPLTIGADLRLAGTYQGQSGRVDLYIDFFADQSDGSELIRRGNDVFAAPNWRLLRSTTLQTIAFDDETFVVRQGAISNGKQQRLLWAWYDIGGIRTTRPTLAKLYYAYHRLTGNNSGDLQFVLSTPIAEADEARAARVLQAFLNAHSAALATCVRGTATSADECLPFDATRD